jgi:tellurite resistance protein
MQQFFATSLGTPAAGSGNIFLDWSRLIETRAMAPEHAWSAPEAFLCLLLAAAVCDGEFSADERDLVRMLAHRSRGLKALTLEQLDALQSIVADRLAAERNLTIEAACAALPAEVRLPAFAHALDIALADGELSASEAELLDTLAQRLDLAAADVRRVADVILLKNQC